MIPNSDAITIAEPRVVVSWTGQGEPIRLRVYAGDNEVAVVALMSVRALALAQELIRPSIQSIKHSQYRYRL